MNLHVGRLVKHLVIAVGIGVLFSSFYAISRPPQHAVRILGGGGFVGICIWLAIWLLEELFAKRIARLRAPFSVLASAILFLVGGVSGWLSGMMASSWLFGFGISPGMLFRGNWVMTMVVTGSIAVAVGLSFYAYEVLERRLERTIEHLKQSEWAEKELELARSIQSRLLPPSFIEADGVTIAARNLPAQFVAGDFYDVVRLDDGSIVIVAADVAGKGVGASLIMASVKAVLPFLARETAQQAMAMLNEKLVHELAPREFVALAYARLRPSDGSLEILNAGFPEPYIVSGREVRALATTGMRFPLGLRSGATYEPLLTHLASGERLVFLSDGIPEAPVNREPLGYERVAAILGQMNDGHARADVWLDAFLATVREAVDEGLADDWTAVVVERA